MSGGRGGGANGYGGNAAGKPRVGCAEGQLDNQWRDGVVFAVFKYASPARVQNSTLEYEKKAEQASIPAAWYDNMTFSPKDCCPLQLEGAL